MGVSPNSGRDLSPTAESQGQHMRKFLIKYKDLWWPSFRLTLYIREGERKRWLLISEVCVCVCVYVWGGYVTVQLLDAHLGTGTGRRTVTMAAPLLLY